MIEVRRAVPADAAELVKLRAVMLGSMSNSPVADGPWQDVARRRIEEWLSEVHPLVAAFVVEVPDHPGQLAANALGVIEQRLGGPDNPSGERGHVSNVATAPAYRRLGYARACMVALLDWFEANGVVRINLNASPDGEPLYRSLGFDSRPANAMRLLQSRPPA